MAAKKDVPAPVEAFTEYGIEKRRLSRVVMSRVPFRPERWSSKSAHTLSDSHAADVLDAYFLLFTGEYTKIFPKLKIN